MASYDQQHTPKDSPYDSPNDSPVNRRNTIRDDLNSIFMSGMNQPPPPPPVPHPPPVPISRPISQRVLIDPVYREPLLIADPAYREPLLIADSGYKEPLLVADSSYRKPLLTDRDPLLPLKVASANDEIMRCMHPPGSIQNPLLFENKTISNLVFNVDDTNMYMKFNQCVFDGAALIGNMKTVTQDGNIVKNTVGSSATLTTVKSPGTKDNPLVFTKITFSHLEFNFGSIEMQFNQCHFIKCVFINGECCVFNHCRFTNVPLDYSHTPYEFHILSSDGKPLNGKICASENLEIKSKRKNLITNLIKYIKSL